MIEQKYSHITCYGCLAHELNLLLRNLAEMKTIEDIVNQGKTVIKEVKGSHILTAIFMEKQKVVLIQVQEASASQSDKKHSIQSLKLPVKTRWGSTVTCLKSIQHNKFVWQAIAVDEQVQEVITK